MKLELFKHATSNNKYEFHSNFCKYYKISNKTKLGH